MYVDIPFILDVRLVDVLAGVTQEEGHTGSLHLPSAVLALIFLAKRIQPFLSLVDHEVEFCVLQNELSVLNLSRIYIYFVRKYPRSCSCTGIGTHVPTSEGFEITNWPPGRPCVHTYIHVLRSYLIICSCPADHVLDWKQP